MKRVFLLAVTAVLSACAEEQTMKPIPAYPGVSELVAMMESGETTSTEIVAELLRRSDAERDLNAYIIIDADRALDRARELDELREAGNLLGPLHGIPLVAKDNIHVAGMPNTAGTPGMADFVPDEDNDVVAALREAGALIIGKANMHELAFGITSDNATYGSVANPYDRTMFPGGSSGGTASAIAAGLIPAGLGTDTGGSVRIPAALTGIVGFRPSTDRYDSTAVTPISHTRDTVGLIGRSVADLVVMDHVIDPGGQRITTVSAGSIRLGVPRAYYFDNVDAQASAVIEIALGKLRDAGITLVETDPPGIDALLATSAFPIALYEVMTDLPAYLEEYSVGKDIGAIAEAAGSPDVQGLFASLLGDGQIPEEVYADALV
ncbi:MAG: amidase family protein, partial [Woeseiaceae bacterium]